MEDAIVVGDLADGVRRFQREASKVCKEVVGQCKVFEEVVPLVQVGLVRVEDFKGDCR
jgi:hypothetical protein